MTYRSFTRRQFMERTAIAAAGSVVTPIFHACTPARQFDVLLRGGWVVDGTGAEPFAADVGIVGERIAGLGSFPSAQAPTIVDVEGRTIAPGFIDVHAHTNLLRNPRAESKIFQGVTLDVTGPDGGSAFPRRRADPAGQSEQPVTALGDCTNYAEWVETHGEGSIAMNLGSYVGHSAVRQLVLGSSAREPNAEELSLMQALVRQAMEQGALGLSSGLEYNPAGFAKTAEVIALAKVAAEFGRIYATHMRSEDKYLVEAVEEAIQIARESGAPLLITHLKVAGQPNWHKIDTVIETIERARAEGVSVRCDRYPYLAYSTGLAFFFPGWSKEGGRFEEFLRNPRQRARMKQETLEKVIANGGWESVMISGGVPEEDKQLLGRRIDEIAKERGDDAFEFACDLLLRGNISIVGFAMNEENTARIISLPYCMISSDGGARPAEPGPGGHPRSFGAFPRALRMYVREAKLLSLQDMIRKMTSLPAETLGLDDRGRIQEGCVADIVVFDPGAITDRATYLEPGQYSDGVSHLLINGKPAIDGGLQTETLHGKIVSAQPR